MARAACLLLVFPDPALVRKAVRAGLDVHAVLGPGDRAGDFPLAEDHVLRADGESSGEAAIRRFVDVHQDAHVLDGAGFPLHGPSPEAGSEAARAPYVLADFAAFRHAMALDKQPAELQTVATAEEVPAAVAGLGWQAVIRTGQDEEAVRSEADVAEWLRTHGPGSGPFLIEQLPPGPEVVVTTLTVDGMHRVIGITERIPQAGTRSYVYPASVPEAATAQARAAVTGMLDLVGYEFGPAQTRVVLTGREPRILRSQPCFSLDRVADLIETATGFDLRTELFRTLAGAPLQPPRPRWFAAARFSRGSGSLAGERESCVLAEGASPEAVRARLDEASAPVS
ncbi:MAG TPA: hypothetical protein VGH57_23175 [Amycolatopsis sp.]